MLALKLVTVARKAYKTALTTALNSINRADVAALNKLDADLLHADTLDKAATRMRKDAELIRDAAHKQYGETCLTVTAAYNDVLNQLDSIKEA